MPLKNYGVLRSKPLETTIAGDSAHLEIHAAAAGQEYRIAFNVRSMSIPPELKYIIFKDFDHPFTGQLSKWREGLTVLEESNPYGLDYIRGNLFDCREMKTAHNIKERDNELLDTVELYIDKAIHTEGAELFAFGQIWGPEEKKRDLYFGFLPGQGIHDIHMNQGNAGRWARDNGVFQDGGLFIHLPSEKRWIAMFLAFQSQTFQTDDRGHALADADLSEETAVAIVGALLNPKRGKRVVSLLNTLDREVDLSGWCLSDMQGRSLPLSGGIPAGTFLQVELDEESELSFPPSGGIITIYDDQGVKICGVSYTMPDYAKKGHTIAF